MCSVDVVEPRSASGWFGEFLRSVGRATLVNLIVRRRERLGIRRRPAQPRIRLLKQQRSRLLGAKCSKRWHIGSRSEARSARSTHGDGVYAHVVIQSKYFSLVYATKAVSKNLKHREGSMLTSGNGEIVYPSLVYGQECKGRSRSD